MRSCNVPLKSFANYLLTNSLVLTLFVFTVVLISTGCSTGKPRLPDGFHSIEYAEGEKYEGEFLDGKKHGRGTYIWRNGDKYTGDFLNDVISGKGIFEYANGERYEGFFLKGNREGYGEYIWPDGKRYAGQWANDQMMAP